MNYIQELFKNALWSTWAVFIDSSVWTLLVIFLCYGVGLFWDHRTQWRRVFTKDVTSKLRSSRWLLWGAVVVFCFHLLFLTPMAMWENEHQQSLTLSSRLKYEQRRYAIERSKPKESPSVRIETPGSKRILSPDAIERLKTKFSLIRPPLRIQIDYHSADSEMLRFRKQLEEILRFAGHEVQTPILRTEESPEGINAWSIGRSDKATIESAFEQLFFEIQENGQIGFSNGKPGEAPNCVITIGLPPR